MADKKWAKEVCFPMLLKPTVWTSVAAMLRQRFMAYSKPLKQLQTFKDLARI